MKHGPFPRIMFLIANIQKKKGCGLHFNPHFLPNYLCDLGLIIMPQFNRTKPTWERELFYSGLYGGFRFREESQAQDTEKGQ